MLSSRPEVTEYYRSICDAIGRYVGDGGSVRLDTNTDDTGNTHIAFIVDTEKLAPYLEGRR